MRPGAIARLLFFVLVLSTLSVTSHAQCITYNGEECLLPPSCLFPLTNNGLAVSFGSNPLLGLDLFHETPCVHIRRWEIVQPIRSTQA